MTSIPLVGQGLGACEIRACLQAGALSAEAVMTGLLERIREYEPHVLAWEWLDADRALALARASDREQAAGHGGPLQGIPVGIKDVIETAGLPTRMGSPLFADHVPRQSAAVIDRLERAGAIIMGKTVTTEFATQCPGKTRNPWNPSHTPGGSSSGSAAAVAAGFVPVAIGTQTRGSTIRPAAYCGIVGYKPSLGAISTAGIFPTSGTLDHVGVFGASVADAALVAASCFDTALDIGFVRPPAPRIALVRSPFWNAAKPEARRCVEAAARHFAGLGARVETVDLPPEFDETLNTINRIQRYELVQLHKDKLAAWRPSLSPQFIEYVDSGRSISADQYQEALAQRAALLSLYEDIVQPYSAILTLSADGEAPTGLQHTGNADCCAIPTLCGVPAVTLPAGHGPAGLPLGVQLAGRHGRDAALLEAALWCEGALRSRFRGDA